MDPKVIEFMNKLAGLCRIEGCGKQASLDIAIGIGDIKWFYCSNGCRQNDVALIKKLYKKRYSKNLPIVTSKMCRICQTSEITHKKNKSNMKRCGRCKKAWYCSVECQRKDWSIHKLECK